VKGRTVTFLYTAPLVVDWVYGYAEVENITLASHMARYFSQFKCFTYCGHHNVVIFSLAIFELWVMETTVVDID
jgi:hypothetical protein